MLPTPMTLVQSLTGSGSNAEAAADEATSSSAAAPQLPSGPYSQVTFMEGEVTMLNRQRPIEMAPFREGRRFHLFCSGVCCGAAEVAEELRAVVPTLTWTSDREQLEACEQVPPPRLSPFASPLSLLTAEPASLHSRRCSST